MHRIDPLILSKIHSLNAIVFHFSFIMKRMQQKQFYTIDQTTVIIQFSINSKTVGQKKERLVQSQEWLRQFLRCILSDYLFGRKPKKSSTRLNELLKFDIVLQMENLLDHNN